VSALFFRCLEFLDARKLGIEVSDDVVGMEPWHSAHLGCHATSFEDSRPEINMFLGDGHAPVHNHASRVDEFSVPSVVAAIGSAVRAVP
jgi:hypothetical protein